MPAALMSSLISIAQILQPPKLHTAHLPCQQLLLFDLLQQRRLLGVQQLPMRRERGGVNGRLLLLGLLAPHLGDGGDGALPPCAVVERVVVAAACSAVSSLGLLTLARATSIFCIGSPTARLPTLCGNYRGGGCIYNTRFKEAMCPLSSTRLNSSSF